MDNGFDLRLSNVNEGFVNEFTTLKVIPVIAILSLLDVIVPLEPAANTSHDLAVWASVLLTGAAPPPPPLLELLELDEDDEAAALVVKLNVPFLAQLPLKSHIVTLK